MGDTRIATDAAGNAAQGATRRRVLKCMAYAGAGVLWTVSGGVPRAIRLGGGEALAATGDFSFMQISDSHIGFKVEPNPDPAATLREALGHIAQMPTRPALLLHTGDVSHLSKPEEFDTADQIIRTAGLETHYVPGEHDVLNDEGSGFFQRFAKESKTGGWYSFDQGGVHFVALVNVLNLKAGGLGYLGAEQIQWLADDLSARSASTPIVVLAHMPLWALYPQWGWGTDDAAQALAHLKRFGSVTVLNGHIHQVMQKVEGTVSFQTARSTAFPQPAAGEGPGPGPLKVPADRLKSMLGIRRIDFVRSPATMTIHDATLGA
jgi:3',5'-cyclic-AMP phosphodiesterase